MDPDSVLRVMQFAARFDVRDGLSWEIDDQDQFLMFVACDDVFAWGTSDGQDLTEDTIDDWETAIQDVQKVGYSHRSYGPLLYCCRQRGMRPQGQQYRLIPEVLWPLFDGCGQEREVDWDNPEPQPRLAVTANVA